MNSYLIGQRVIANGEIVVCINAPNNLSRSNSDTVQWVRFDSGLVQWRAVENIKPLPNGQL